MDLRVERVPFWKTWVQSHLIRSSSAKKNVWMHLCCDFRGTVTLSHVWNFFSFRWMKLSLRNVGVSCMSRHVHVNIKKICKSGRKNRKGVNKFYIKPFVLTPAVSFPVELSPCACSADREASVFRHTHTHTRTHTRALISCIPVWPDHWKLIMFDHVFCLIVEVNM